MTPRSALAGLACGLTLAGCSGIQSALDPAADQATHIQDIWTLMLWVCGVMYALVLAFLAAALWRARRSLAAPPMAEGHDSPAERPLQRALTGWTGLVVAGLLVLTLGSFLVDRELSRVDTADAVRIRVTGAQWWWKAEYDDPVPANRLVTANELRLPVGRPAIVELRADDVIHSFWIPNLAGKIDLIPGRTNTLTLNPRRVGVFRGQCAEFCGLQHSQMALDARVETPEAFEAWRRAQQAPAREPTTARQARGLQVFLGAACAACHQIRGTPAGGRTGPDLTHLAGRRYLAAGALANDPGGLMAWLHDPQAVKPGNRMPEVKLSPADLDALVAYLGSLA